MDTGKRIYDIVSNIDGDSVQKLFDKRANMNNGFTSVLLGDQNPNYAQLWDEYEKKMILPKLNLTGNEIFIDIGCGIGRWAETVIPHCRYYCGCDFSSEMIMKAKERVVYPSAHFDFINCPFQKIGDFIKDSSFDRGIIAGVCMYINDADLKNCFDTFLQLVSKHAILYFTETVAIEKRLTLNGFYSDAMHTEYSSIYRTPKEYNELYAVFQNAGFEIVEQGFLPHLNNEQEYSETDRWYTILKR